MPVDSALVRRLAFSELLPALFSLESSSQRRVLALAETQAKHPSAFVERIAEACALDNPAAKDQWEAKRARVNP